jgi:hypothetical protein
MHVPVDRFPLMIVAAGLCVTCGNAMTAHAQTSAASPAAVSPAAQTAAGSPAGDSTPAAAAKKVWTNEDVSELRDEPISTVGKGGAKPAKAGPGSKAGPSDSKNSRLILNQITRLRAQIPELESQITQLQAAISGQATGDARSSTRPYGVRLDSWQSQLAQAQKKRDDTLARISELEDQARHSGVPANNIP